MSEPTWSVSETEVFAQARSLLDTDREAVVATIIDVDGSAYRRPGAKMIIPEDGGGFGHITAGCLEDEVERLAEDVLAEGERRIVTYDLRPEAEEDVWGLGVGCNGILDILLEPLDESFRPVIQAREAGRRTAVVTVVGDEEATVGGRAYYDLDEDSWDGIDRLPGDLGDRIRPAARNLARTGKADRLAVGGIDMFVDGISPPGDLVVIGTGHDVGPIVELGNRADFRVTVVGFRGAATKADRFPDADRVLSTSPVSLREAVTFDEDTYVVVATHNFIDDRLSVEELLETSVPYIGLMGPDDRFEEMVADFASEDRQLTTGDYDRIYTPVGLDLGGGSPHQIALSIVSEVMAVANGRTPKHLREREGHIHDRLELTADGGDGPSS